MNPAKKSQQPFKKGFGSLLKKEIERIKLPFVIVTAGVVEIVAFVVAAFSQIIIKLLVVNA